MNRKKYFQEALWTITITVLLAGCSIPAATPTSSPLSESADEIGVVNFDGTGCTVSLPTELPPGRYSVGLSNSSEEDVHLFVSRHITDKTFQDVLDLQGEPFWRKGVSDGILLVL